MKIIKTQSGDFTRSKGKEVMESSLRSPDAKNITALLPTTTTWRSVPFRRWKRRVSTRQRHLDCLHNGIKEALEAIKAGKLNCSVESNPLIGDQIMDLTKKLASRQEVPRFLHSKEGLFDSSNAAAMLPARKY